MGASALAVGFLWVLPGAAQSAADKPTSGDSQVRELRSKGLDLLYNLDYQDALAVFQQAIARSPDEPALYRLAASVVWMGILFERGAILVDDYLGQAREVIERPPPPPGADQLFRRYISRALDLAEQGVRERPDDPDAHYQLGASEGFFASYIATVEGRLVGGIGRARRAVRAHERALQLDPSRMDAGLVPGAYRYSVSVLPFPLRLLARLVGMPSGREQGIRQVEEAASFPGDAQTDAMFILIVIYNREGRYDDALRVIRDLQQRYPRNRLLWLEAGTTALRANDTPAARAEIERGLAISAGDPRRRALAEDARWRLAYASALLRSDPAAAARELRAALMEDSPAWVSGRVHKELGKVADLDGDRAAALAEYSVARRLCRTGDDRVCTDEIDRLMRTPYR